MSEAIEFTPDEIQGMLNRLDFIENRLNGVAFWVVGWMPPEDNELHHNAVEHLQRADQEREKIRELLAARLKARFVPQG